jgi:hypothetical protein
LRREIGTKCPLKMAVDHESAGAHRAGRRILTRCGGFCQTAEVDWIAVVIASEAKQSRGRHGRLDCFVAIAPRNDDAIFAERAGGS